MRFSPSSSEKKTPTSSTLLPMLLLLRATVSKTVRAMAPQGKIRVDEFLNSEDEKSDYDWIRVLYTATLNSKIMLQRKVLVGRVVL
ncbi:hypothetical protein TB2_044144 [Malus domestica]